MSNDHIYQQLRSAFGLRKPRLSDNDQLDWNIERDGRMRDHATPYDTVTTEPYTPVETLGG